jgi:NAD-dependent deacetylase
MKYEQLQEWVTQAQKIVFFGGAGVSTESGIPDFRSTDGLYHQQWRDPPETILSHGYFWTKTEAFYDFYRKKMLFPDAKPNPAHLALAELEKRGILSAVITQNIDGLHQKAGSKNVLELHGSIHRAACMDCHKKWTLDDIINAEGIPHCTCGGLIKPDVVLYGEALDPDVLSASIDHIQRADLLIVGGTSLNVYPAAGLIDYFRGDKIVIINKTETGRDSDATLTIRDSIGKVLSEAVG